MRNVISILFSFVFFLLGVRYRILCLKSSVLQFLQFVYISCPVFFFFVGDIFILGKLVFCYMSCQWIHLLMAWISFLNSLFQKGFMGILLFKFNI